MRSSDEPQLGERPAAPYADGVPEVSVVIPTFRRGAGVRPTLDTVLAQDGVDLEILFVDDHSADGSLDALRETATDGRVRILESERNAGPGAARDRGTAQARAPIVAYIDDDDLWTPTHLRECLDAMTGSAARWAYGGVQYVDPQLRSGHTPPLADPARIFELLLTGNVLITPSSLLVERALVAEIGGWDGGSGAGLEDGDFMLLEDWDFMLRLADVAPAAAAPSRTVLYVRHAASVSQRSLGTFEAQFELFRRRHDAAAARHGARIRTELFYRWLAFEHRSAGHRRAAARSFAKAAVDGHRVQNLLRAAQALMLAPRASR